MKWLLPLVLLVLLSACGEKTQTNPGHGDIQVTNPIVGTWQYRGNLEDPVRGITLVMTEKEARLRVDCYSGRAEVAVPIELGPKTYQVFEKVTHVAGNCVAIIEKGQRHFQVLESSLLIRDESNRSSSWMREGS